MRYSFFSDVHRYIRHDMFALAEAMAKVDFRDDAQRKEIKGKFDALVEFLHGHAEGEEMFQTPLLKAKKSPVEGQMELEHKAINEEMIALANKLSDVMRSTTPEEQQQLGYAFYLSYTIFMGNYMQHLVKEETVIMPEFHRLYTDKELRAVTLGLYPQMSQDKLIDMVKTFFPYVNAWDREVMLQDIYDSIPNDKFIEIWKFIAPTLQVVERKILADKFKIDEANLSKKPNPSGASGGGGGADAKDKAEKASGTKPGGGDGDAAAAAASSGAGGMTHAYKTRSKGKGGAAAAAAPGGASASGGKRSAHL
jgi:iron-sulfur cluster repair protein YtfE (RIC family)